MLRCLSIFFILILTSYSYAEIKDKIIQNLKNTNNLDFRFEQNINGKIENGKIVLKYKESKKEAYSFTTKYDRIENFGETWIIYTKTPYFMFCNNQIRITTELNLFEDCVGDGKMHGMKIKIDKNENEIAITIMDVSYTPNSEDINYRF